MDTTKADAPKEALSFDEMVKAVQDGLTEDRKQLEAPVAPEARFNVEAGQYVEEPFDSDNYLMDVDAPTTANPGAAPAAADPAAAAAATAPEPKP